MVLLKIIYFPAHVSKSSLDITLYKEFSWIFPDEIILFVSYASLYYFIYQGLVESLGYMSAPSLDYKIAHVMKA